MAIGLAQSSASSSAQVARSVSSEATGKTFSLENTVSGGNEMGEYYPYSLSSWLSEAGDDIFYYNADGVLVKSSPDGTESDVISHSALGAVAGGGYVSIQKVINSSGIWVSTGRTLMLVDAESKAVKAKIESTFDDVAFAPKSGSVSFTDGANLYVWSDGKQVKVNPGGEPGVLYGSTVHRNEFGINGGMFWSPDGTKLCFYRKDESMVANYPLVDVTQRTGEVVDTRYPMAGETSEEVSVGIYDVSTRKTTYLKTASPVNRYFTNVSWSPDGTKISVAEVNRDQDHMWFNVYDAKSGKLEGTLFEEENPRWVEPCEPPVWTDNSHFVWASYRDGYRHIYLYGLDKSVKQLTSGNWCVTEVYGFDDKNGLLIVQTNKEGYLFRNVCSISLDGKMSRLSPERSFSRASYTGGKQRLVINSSSASVAKTAVICSTDGRENREVSRNVDPYAEFSKPEIRLVDLKTADGSAQLSGRVILPVGFDPAKKYPVIVYVYGGPHSQLVDGSWLYGASPWMLYFAQEGYIVFTMDNRGTEFRGSDYEQCVHRRLGECEMQDQMVGVNYLKNLPYVDTKRIGVHGWSFGGFMTISLLTTYPDVFKAGVAGGPVCDWKYYEVMYGERYMDTPQQNPGGYAANSLLNKISDLKARLLVIHGSMDSTVVWQHSQQLINSAIEKGVYFDYFIYPNHPHNVSGHDRTHLMGYIKRYFDDWLKRE